MSARFAFNSTYQVLKDIRRSIVYNRVSTSGLLIMMLLLLLTVILIVGVWFRWRYNNRRLLEFEKSIPGPPALPIVGNALKFMGQPGAIIEVLKAMIEEYGEVFKFWLGKDLNIVVSNPDDIKILLTNPKTIFKGPQYKYMADVLGGGILSGSGTIWRKHRKIANPNYGKQAIESYTDIFNAETNLLLEKWKTLPCGQRMDIYDTIVLTTSYVVSQTLLGLTKAETLALPGLQYIVDTSPWLYDIIFNRMTKWYLQLDPVFWLTKSYLFQRKFIMHVDEFCKAVIQRRLDKLSTLKKDQQELSNGKDDSVKNTRLSVIDRFLLSNEFDSKDMIEETFTVFTSSQEASAKIASFLLLMMAYHPNCQDLLYAEIKSVMGDRNDHVTDKDLKQMPYLDMAFKEVLRLFPIAVMVQRTITEDIKISSCTIPAGCALVIPIYHIHRDPRFWENPDDFDPQRFTAENIKARPTNSYLPFSIGPMDCLGRYFGTKLVKTIVVKVLQEYMLTAVDEYKDMTIVFAISTTKDGGFPAILNKRKTINYYV